MFFGRVITVDRRNRVAQVRYEGYAYDTPVGFANLCHVDEFEGRRSRAKRRRAADDGGRRTRRKRRKKDDDDDGAGAGGA